MGGPFFCTSGGSSNVSACWEAHGEKHGSPHMEREHLCRHPDFNDATPRPAPRSRPCRPPRPSNSSPCWRCATPLILDVFSARRLTLNCLWSETTMRTDSVWKFRYLKKQQLVRKNEDQGNPYPRYRLKIRKCQFAGACLLAPAN